ncbi:MAG: ABC transporter permease [Bacteroidaceae bacterium]|nr:ABC transporter permease [Bacteroidaceae bacterium]
MIKKIFHQIWNERKENAWIFFELLAVSIFMWLAIDPLFNLISRDSVDKGYDSENIYNITFTHHNRRSPKYKAELDNATTIRESYKQMLHLIESLPEVESYAISEGDFPGGNSYCSWDFIVDSTMRADNKEIKKNVIFYTCIETIESDFFETFGIKDTRTGEILKKDKNGNEGVYISKSLAKELFDTESTVGKSIKMHDSDKSFNVLGVFKDAQPIIYNEQGKLMVIVRKYDDPGSIRHVVNNIISIKLKDGVDKYKFEKRMEDEIKPRLRAGNLYCDRILSHERLKNEFENTYGIKNKYRQNFIISSFAILCTLLGIIGTFWVRVVARRQEIGIMQSMGATRATIVKQFILEATLLASIAFAIAMPIVLHKIYAMGFAEPLVDLMRVKPIGETLAWRNKPVPHFIIVSAISYFIVVVASIVGAAIPVASTVKKEPVESLREE